MVPETFFQECGLPTDWRNVIRLEILTGCSECGRRLLHDGLVRPGTTIEHIAERNGTVTAAWVFCANCERNA